MPSPSADGPVGRARLPPPEEMPWPGFFAPAVILR